MIIGRDQELKTLERHYAKPGFQFPVLFGRRRVGKTYLMSAFIQDKPCIFFTAVEDNAAINLRNLSREIYTFQHGDSDPELAPLYPDFQTAFEAVFALARDKRLVFIIDEYPYLAKADTSVPSILQALIDRNKDTSQLFLMLCGSSLTFMREKVLGSKSPLYGRRTAQMELKPLDYFDARRFFPDAAPQDTLAYFGIAGGIPLYLLQFDPNLPVSENIEQELLSPDALLYEEPLNLLRQEVTKAGMYNEVIGAIACGKTTNNEIATSIGVATSELTYYLKELQAIGLVEKKTPVVSSSRRPVYRLRDNLFAFWYRFVLPNRSTIERGMPRRALRDIETHMPQYLGPVFESVCAGWLWRQNVSAALPVEFDELGSWWGTNPTLKREEEIDLVALDAGTIALVGECKWRNDAVDASVDDTLKARMELVRTPQDAHRYLFSKSGFTPGCEERSDQDDKLHLVAFDSM